MQTIMVVVFYIVMEVGLGCTYGNTMTHALQNISAKDNSDGNAVFNTFGQLAGSMGTSISAVILTLFQPNAAYSSLTEQPLPVFLGFCSIPGAVDFEFCISNAAFRKATVK